MVFNLKKPWQGRFKKDTSGAFLNFTASLPYDRRLAGQDLAGSLAHVEMLDRCGIISHEEAAAIKNGLEKITAELQEGSFPYSMEFEDIHMNIEKRLIEIVGPVGGKMHTARSRNDQVALDMHLYVMDEIKAIDSLLHDLQGVFIELAHRFMGIVFPGYTHLQRAQPVLLSHHILAYFWMLERDRERLEGVFRRADIMPLGAGALAGTSFPIDRELVAGKLGFSRLYENSMDAVSDRDYIVEFLSFCALLMSHISKLGEELIIWSSAEFAFIELDDAFTTGSSMMPQKKNPDLAELARGKTGRVYGSLMAILTVLKGLPLTYNKDLQEDKEGLFDTVDMLKQLLPLLGEMLQKMKLNEERISDALADDYACATDLADYLVQQGLPFRDAHGKVGSLIRWCQENKVRLKDTNREQRLGFHEALGDDIGNLLDPHQVVNSRRSRGGTAGEAVQEQLKRARQRWKDRRPCPQQAGTPSEG